ncbi:thioredoxin domain-containing protein [Flavivirga spongiicola]|uniref:Thioredoxin domain-containing protein n=1 Tax=Flavivirga spongiicola TaxID=421621 RepID=A0ABU7XUD4_9FLAO|nr:thioredoxin domain-containing protein [Flavivirga sp. MEBiC05379]MDO5978452.1 thioredoxin domain-containing protein [Flavivirga sp. MEBiC05379]
MKRTVTLLIILLNLHFGFSQTLNSLSLDKKGNELLLGEINRHGLTKNSFNDWFSKNHSNYLVNTKVVKLLKNALKDYEVKVFLGTWCGDSKREVPRFYKVLDAANFPENRLKVVAVNRTTEAYKQSPNHEEKGLNIHRVPTFIFYKDGKEVNRIVESPKETLERDMLKIVSNETYSSNYMAVNYIDHQLNSKTIDDLKLEELVLVSKLAELVKGSRELNTYGYSLLSSNQTKKALYVFDLNTKIFPYKHNVYDSLGEAYFKTKNINEALKNYYKVLSLKPDDKNALKMIEAIKFTN